MSTLPIPAPGDDGIVRYIGKCAGCKKPAAINYTTKPGATGTDYYRPDGRRVAAFALGRFWCDCGKLAQLKPMKRAYDAAKKCDARCRNARGPECVCACGGLNHGGGYNLVTFNEPEPAKPAPRPAPVTKETAPKAKPVNQPIPFPVQPAPPVPASPAPVAVTQKPMASGFVPSAYQAAVFDWIQTGRGDAIIQAVAGSGKTKTLEEAAKLIRASDILFCCFNNHIKAEAAEKMPKHVKVSTVHSIGYGMVVRHLSARKLRIDVQGPKYSRIVRAYVNAAFGQAFDAADRDDVIDSLKEIVEYCQNSLIDPADPEALRSMMDHFGLYCRQLRDGQISTAVRQVLEEGKRMAAEEGIVAFTDQVWLPYVWNLRPWQHSWVLVDECQDLSPAQLDIAMKCRKPGGRMLFVGDRAQAIMGFAGADSESMDNIKLRTGATEMPLSICYRCPASHIGLAKEIVPHIEARPNAPAGDIQTIKEEEVASHIHEGDLIVCRTTAPLVKLCFELIASGVPARVRGRKIGEGLVAFMKKAAKMPGFKAELMVESLERFRDLQVRGLQEGGKQEDHALEIDSIVDKTACLLVIWRRSMPRDLYAFEEAILELFSDGRPSVMLSTVHRAKGLEENRVFILNPDLLPHPRAKKDWEITQEYNLKYVALTRAKQALFFVTPKPKDKADDLAE